MPDFELRRARSYQYNLNTIRYEQPYLQRAMSLSNVSNYTGGLGGRYDSYKTPTWHQPPYYRWNLNDNYWYDRHTYHSPLYWPKFYPRARHYFSEYLPSSNYYFSPGYWTKYTVNYATPGYYRRFIDPAYYYGRSSVPSYSRSFYAWRY